MPSWVTVLLQILPTVIAEITALIQSFQGGSPTPAQSEQLKALMEKHDALLAAAKSGMGV